MDNAFVFTILGFRVSVILLTWLLVCWRLVLERCLVFEGLERGDVLR